MSMRASVTLTDTESAVGRASRERVDKCRGARLRVVVAVIPDPHAHLVVADVGVDAGSAADLVDGRGVHGGVGGELVAAAQAADLDAELHERVEGGLGHAVKTEARVRHR